MTAAEFLPAERSLASLAEAARGCTGCPLYADATQTVFGEGGERARLMFVGEQPGDREDIEGKPFVGPAGRLLDDVFRTLKIPRGEVYVTNAVKHFKWKPKGKRRIHEKPRASEIAACLPWLEAEIEAVEPELIVCLGATATQALLGREARVLQDRGRVRESPYGPVLVTVHPSSILRAQEEERHAALQAFTTDLRRGLEYLEAAGRAPRSA